MKVIWISLKCLNFNDPQVVCTDTCDYHVVCTDTCDYHMVCTETCDYHMVCTDTCDYHMVCTETCDYHMVWMHLVGYCDFQAATQCKFDQSLNLDFLGLIWKVSQNVKLWLELSTCGCGTIPRHRLCCCQVSDARTPPKNAVHHLPQSSENGYTQRLD